MSELRFNHFQLPDSNEYITYYIDVACPDCQENYKGPDIIEWCARENRKRVECADELPGDFEIIFECWRCKSVYTAYDLYEINGEDIATKQQWDEDNFKGEGSLTPAWGTKMDVWGLK
jgi:hypothetical protein